MSNDESSTNAQKGETPLRQQQQQPQRSAAGQTSGTTGPQGAQKGETPLT